MVFPSQFMPCVECGESVHQAASATHRCDPDRLAEFAVFRMRESIARFEDDLLTYLCTSRGQFDTWLAARQVRGHRLR